MLESTRYLLAGYRRPQYMFFIIPQFSKAGPPRVKLSESIASKLNLKFVASHSCDFTKSLNSDNIEIEVRACYIRVFLIGQTPLLLKTDRSTPKICGSAIVLNAIITMNFLSRHSITSLLRRSLSPYTNIFTM